MAILGNKAETVGHLNHIIEAIENAGDEKSSEFLTSVHERAGEMLARIEQYRTCTLKQADTARNWRNAVDKALNS